MSDLLMAGSLMAAFAGGMVAFFAPCCAGVMTPAYLAAIGGGRRARVARPTAVYVAGVALVVLPITLGAAALSSYLSRWHAQLFVAGGLMMIGVAVALWRGSMLPIDLPRPRLNGSMLSVFGLGLFSGGATACCAPVLVGAVALSVTGASIGGGLLLGVAYVAGMMVPLIPLALVYGKVSRRVTDRRVTVRIGAYAKPIGMMRLAGAVVFAGFGALFIALALTGNSDTAPGFQATMGRWMRELSDYLDEVPNVITVPVLAALLAGFAYAVLKGGRGNERQEGEGRTPGGAPVAVARVDHDETL